MTWKNLLTKLLRPPVWIMLILALICTASLLFVFVGGYETLPSSCASYVLSFYTLSVIVLRCIKVIPAQYKAAKKKVYDHPLGNRYFTDPKFKTHISLYCSLTVSLLYVTMNGISFFLYHSAWFVILTFYYMILAVMRFLLVRFVKRLGISNDRFKELQRSRLCGIILLAINLFLSGAVLMIIYQNKGYKYHGIMIYIMAAYTFYITAVAIVNLVKYRRMGSPVMSMTKIINMAAALVSMLSLETAMFSEFGEEMSPENQRVMIALTGAGVSIIIVTMSVYSIVKNSREIKLIMEKKAYGE